MADTTFHTILFLRFVNSFCIIFKELAQTFKNKQTALDVQINEIKRNKMFFIRLKIIDSYKTEIWQQGLDHGSKSYLSL